MHENIMAKHGDEAVMQDLLRRFPSLKTEDRED